jgi:hypothetical protein
VDEVRVASVARSPNWLAATWRNMASNSVFNLHAPASVVSAGLAPTLVDFGLAGDRPEFLIGGEAGFTYLVQASTNLTHWVNLYTNPPGLLPVLWTDADAPGFRQRFYRVVLVP